MLKKITALFSLCAISAFALPLKNPNEILQMPIPGEYIVKFKNEALVNKSHQSNIIWKNQTGVISKVLLNQKSFKELESDKNIAWIQPNYEYIGNAMEVIPNDPQFADQFHHTIINTPMAWEIERGSSDLIVAVTDNGFDLDHDDLKNVYWKNTNEIPNNGIDDDNNGYIDDVNAWNFDENNNNPSYDDNSHGTHVAGIIAAEYDNATGVAGIAPGVKIMPIKFYGKGRWTSEVVANSYAYAINNGAKIITTSYNIDGFVNDRLYLDSIKMIRDRGALLFNSAGNNSRMNPPRRVFEEVVLVCSTKSNGASRSSADELSRFSNYGEGIDICAPGDPILSTVNGKYQGMSRYGSLSGTSMAAPAAAAVAALIWSKYPELSAEEVLEKLYNTADSINSQNPRRIGQMGAGRINAFRAVSE